MSDTNNTLQEPTTIYMIGARTKVIMQGGEKNQNTFNEGTIIQGNDAATQASDTPSNEQTDHLNTYELPPQLFTQWLIMQNNLTTAKNEIELLRQQIDIMRKTIDAQDLLLQYLTEKDPPF